MHCCCLCVWCFRSDEHFGKSWQWQTVDNYGDVNCVCQKIQTVTVDGCCCGQLTTGRCGWPTITTGSVLDAVFSRCTSATVVWQCHYTISQYWWGKSEAVSCVSVVINTWMLFRQGLWISAKIDEILCNVSAVSVCNFWLISCLWHRGQGDTVKRLSLCSLLLL